MQFQQINTNTYIYPIYKNSKDTTKGFLKYNYLNSKYYKVNNEILNNHRTTTNVLQKEHSFGDIKLLKSDIVLILLLILFAIVAYVKISGKNFINRITTAITNNSYSDSFYNEKNVFLKLYGYLLSFVFFISYSLLVTSSINTFFPHLVGENWFSIFFIVLFFILILYTLQNLLFLILGSVFLELKLAKEHLFYVSILIKFSGIVFLVIFSAIFFSDVEIKKNLIYFAILLSFGFYFLKIIRTTVTFLRKGFSILYMFLYFCAFEIIPVLLLVKILLLLIELNTSILNVVI